MYRLYGALSVLGAVLLISLFGFYLNKTTSDSIIDHLDASFESAEEGKTDRAIDEINEAQKLLHSRLETMFLFVSHRKLDEIEQCINKSKYYLINNDLTSFYVYCSSSLELIRDYRDMEYPTFYNIL